MLLALVGRDLAGQFLFGVGAFGLGVADRVEEAADLADVVAAGGHPGAGGRDELVAGVDRAEAVVGDAGALGGVGQRGGDPVRLGAAAGDAVGELADGGGLVLEPAAVPVEAVALAGDLGGAGGDLAALVLDPALGLVLLGVPEPGQAALERLALGPAGLPVGLGRPLRGDGDAAGGGRPRQPLGVIGGDVGPGLHPVQCELHMGTEVGLIVRPELAHGRVGGGQVVEELLHGGEVLEVPGGLLDEVVIDRGQTGGQRVRDLDRVKVLGQQRAAQRQQQVEELGVPLPAEAEQAVIDQVPVLGRGPPPGVRLEDGAELALGQRAGVGRQQPEVHPDPLAGDEERHPDAVGVPVGAHADDQRHGLGVGFVGFVGAVGPRAARARANSIQT